MDVKRGNYYSYCNYYVCFAFALDKELLQRITTEVRPYSKGRISRNQRAGGTDLDELTCLDYVFWSPHEPNRVWIVS